MLILKDLISSEGGLENYIPGRARQKHKTTAIGNQQSMKMERHHFPMDVLSLSHLPLPFSFRFLVIHILSVTFLLISSLSRVTHIILNQLTFSADSENMKK